MARRKKDPMLRGIIRDDNGVVVARRAKHPLQHLLTAIPADSPDYPDAQIPPMNLPDELKQLVAVHVFDNLYPGIPAPPEPGETWTVTSSTGAEFTIGSSTYRLVNPSGDSMPMGGNGETWLAHAIPGEAAVPDEVVDMTAVPEVDDLSEAEFEALQARVMQRIEDEARVSAMDAQARPEKPDWQKWREEKFGGDA
ncbi:hypothetical protein JVX90_00340 [Gordonia sp. PDNC005]|uniref:hypothetical protein n=1 Tax=Gordonia sp. PDNC005 TaxID=2811424 RepID=UPI0019630433|nr:hypothetical protein [Gordonia sp. PDNC005]QRY62761.1 hypothetical protein JVX90_00340 [Gordonia sp. PDNC005]